jgi:hypothetical protein
MFVVVGIAGAVAGAVVLSVLTALLSAVIEPESFGEGQFVMGFAFTVPVGMMLGSVTSLVVRQARRGHRTRAGGIATIGGTAILAFATAIAWGSASSRDGGFAEFLREVFSLWIGPSWLAGAGLLVWGTFQLVTRR